MNALIRSPFLSGKSKRSRIVRIVVSFAMIQLMSATTWAEDKLGTVTVANDRNEIFGETDVALCGTWAPKMDDTTRMRVRPNSQIHLWLPPTRGAHLQVPPHVTAARWTIARREDSKWLKLMANDREFGDISLKEGSLRIRIVSDKYPRDAVLERVTQWSGEVVNGRPEGTWNETVVRSGELCKQVELRAGAIHGKCRSFSFGKISSEADYEDGLKHGVERIWHGTENISTESCYVRGNLDGPCKVYDEDGMLLGTLIYRDGKPWSGRYISSAPSRFNHQPREFGWYTNGQKSGEWVTFDFLGQMQSRDTFTQFEKTTAE